MRRSSPARGSTHSLLRRASGPRPVTLVSWARLSVMLGLVVAASVPPATVEPAPASPVPLLKGSIRNDAPANTTRSDPSVPI